MTEAHERNPAGNTPHEQIHEQPTAPPRVTRPANNVVIGAIRRLVCVIVRVHLLASVLLVVTTLLLIVWTPPKTVFMLNDPRPDIPFVHDTADLKHVSRYVIAAVLLHEDAHLGDRFLPFDVSHFVDRGRRYAQGANDQSGSTIPQQMAKNLFLTRGKNFVRKGYEVPISFVLDVMLSDERLMELYLNEAQFAQNLYGICSASWYYFDSAPWNLTQTQAAMLAGLLPSGDFAKRSADGGIDLSNPDSSSTQSVWRALQILPEMLVARDGWEPVVNSIGITDKASDHAAGRSSVGACSVMPQDVAARISWEDARR